MSWFKTPEQLTAEQSVREKRIRIRELEKLLSNTDHKMYADYGPKQGEDVDRIIADRSAWRSEIRSLIAEVPDDSEQNAS